MTTNRKLLRCACLVGLVVLPALLSACDKDSGSTGNGGGGQTGDGAVRAGGDAVVSAQDGGAREPDADVRRLRPPDVRAELPDRSAIPPSSLQKCLCYPTGSYCDIHAICATSTLDVDPFDEDRWSEAVKKLRERFNNPEMECPDGEVCTGDYSGPLKGISDDIWLGRCHRLCSASRRDYQHPTDTLCNENEDCHVEAITWCLEEEYNTKVAVCDTPQYDVFPVADTGEPESDVYPK